MARVKVKLADNIARVVFIDPEATKGAILGSTVYLPSGQVGTPVTVRQWLGIAGASGRLNHSELENLQADDHPQYTMWAAKERITGRWTFANTVDVFIGDTQQWIIDENEVFQVIPQVIRNNDGIFVQVPDRTWCGFQVTVENGAVDGDVTAWWWETNGLDPEAEINGFRWHLEGELLGEAYFQLFRHNNSVPGIEVMRFTRTTAGIDVFEQMREYDGTNGVPSYSFTSDPDTGMFRRAANELGLAAAGVTGISITGTVVTSFRQIQGNNGSAATPSFSFTNDPDCGMFRSGTNAIGWSVNSVESMTLITTALNLIVPVQGASGLATGPTFSFSGDPNTGMFSAGADSLGFSAGGTVRLTVNTGNITTSVPILVAGGSVSAPGYSFALDTNVGFYLASGDTLGFVTSGTEWVRINASGAIGLSGANYGDEGQVFTSHGSALPPTWENAAGGGSSLVYVNDTIPAGNTVANTTSETAFTSTYDIAANSLAVGTVVRIKLYGIYGTDAVPPTLRLRVKLDSTTVLDTTAVTLTAALADDGWTADIQCVVRAIGASGSVDSQGLFEFSSAVADGQLVNTPNSTAAVIDTTAAQTVSVTAQWGAADADNTVTLRQIAIWLEQAVDATSFAAATFLTEDDETAVLPNARRLVAGSNITFDTTTPGELEISSTGGGGGSSISTEILADSPTGYWKLTEASGNFADSSGAGNTLVASGTIRYRNMYLDRKNPSDLFAYFTSTGGAWIAGSLGVAVPLSGDWTIEGIAYFPGNSGSSGCVFGIGKTFVSANNNFQALFYRSTATMQAFWEQDSGTNVQTSASTATTWPESHHFVLVKDGTANTVTFFVDGVQFGDPIGYANEPTGGTDVNSGVGAIPGQANSGCGLGHVAFYNGIKLSNARIAVHAAAAGY